MFGANLCQRVARARRALGNEGVPKARLAAPLAPPTGSGVTGDLGPATRMPLTRTDALGTAYLTARPDGIQHLGDRALVTHNATELAEVELGVTGDPS